jgi:hypothetical protein
MLQPQRDIAFTCRLVDVFDIQDLNDCVLHARWDRGCDPSGNRYLVDRDLAVEIKLPARPFLTKKIEPNKSPEPTPTAVTGCACAHPAPAVVVARL